MSEILKMLCINEKYQVAHTLIFSNFTQSGVKIFLLSLWPKSQNLVKKFQELEDINNLYSEFHKEESTLAHIVSNYSL